MTYEIRTPITGLQYVFRCADNTVIPMDPGNRDYQAYLAWVAEDNVATSLPQDVAQEK